MLLSPPRPLDFMLGFTYLCISALVYTISYYLNTSADPDTQRLHAVLISYGYCQGLIGFFAGLWLARMTQVENKADAQPAEEEEEAMLMVIRDV